MKRVNGMVGAIRSQPNARAELAEQPRPDIDALTRRPEGRKEIQTRSFSRLTPIQFR